MGNDATPDDAHGTYDVSSFDDESLDVLITGLLAKLDAEGRRTLLACMEYVRRDLVVLADFVDDADERDERWWAFQAPQGGKHLYGDNQFTHEWTLEAQRLDLDDGHAPACKLLRALTKNAECICDETVRQPFHSIDLEIKRVGNVVGEPWYFTLAEPPGDRALRDHIFLDLTVGPDDEEMSCKFFRTTDGERED